jgi:Helix-turn-helix of DDE superfamily endonuclease
VVLLYLRHNLSQDLLAELFCCSQPTVSRLQSLLIPVLTDLLTPLAERIAERELASTVRVDGFLVPSGDRRRNTYTSGTYPGKRHKCGFNVQLVASWRGRTDLTGDPMPGAMHDAMPGANRAWPNASKAGCTPTADPAGSPTPPTSAPDYSFPNAAPDPTRPAYTPASSTR